MTLDLSGAPSIAPRESCTIPAEQCSALRAFTLIELLLVLALLVVATSIAAPALSKFVRGRALDSETRRVAALMHAGQSRAVSEGMPMIVWISEKTGAYGLEAESSGESGDAKAEKLDVDPSLQIAVASESGLAMTLFKDLPAIRFLPDGSVDESSPQKLRLTDTDGFTRWLVLGAMRMGYEIRLTEK